MSSDSRPPYYPDLQLRTHLPAKPQAELFPAALMPRQLPVYKHGPEEEALLAPRFKSRDTLH